MLLIALPSTLTRSLSITIIVFEQNTQQLNESVADVDSMLKILLYGTFLFFGCIEFVMGDTVMYVIAVECRAR